MSALCSEVPGFAPQVEKLTISGMRQTIGALQECVGVGARLQGLTSKQKWQQPQVRGGSQGRLVGIKEGEKIKEKKSKKINQSINQ